MQTVAHSNFITIKTEGGILPADLLQRIAVGAVDGLNPTDYHLPATERLNEAINRSWNRLSGVWQAFQRKMEQAAPSETGTTMTRDWLLTLLQELGYGRLPYQGRLEVGNAEWGIGSGENTSTPHSQLPTPYSYPISHLYDHTPIHLVSFQQKLDSPDHSQAVKRSPHSLVQECLNRSDTYLWGFVSNGLRLRILRDNISLTRVAYAEFDLEAMFAGELYADFSLLWLLCHQSRVETLPSVETLPATSLPSNCWLEQWSQQAAEQGTRALDALRDGVQEAIAALGRGFLAHPANQQLKDDLRSGTLTTQDYYRQLLRLVYRLLFLFVAEDRGLLLLPGRDVAVQRLYDRYYSISRLRRLAETRRGGPHPDLYHTLTRLFTLLRAGYEPLGLPGLGSFLFSERATPGLDAAHIANQDLLTAVRALAFTAEGQVRRPVDYKNLGPEELGSVYESLLELHPQMHVASASFSLDVVTGSERKTTGSYYTPASLIQSLLDSALEPVVTDRLQQAGRGLRSHSHEWQAACEKALLDIKVVDPAAGSGHFLIAAARRLARHLARIRTGDEEPGPGAVRHALRDVVGHCIHGVDINEMAVELCKVALWMETLDPGQPLSFLDRKIRPGNSLIGATPTLLHGGIPDDAFNPMTGDDKSYCREWKKRNKEQRQGQMELFRADMQPWERLGDFADAMRHLEMIDDHTLAGVQAQEAEYERLVQSSDYAYGKLWADAWCAAFVWVKRGEEGSREWGIGNREKAPTAHSLLSTPSGWPYPITEQVFRNLERSPYREPQWLKDEVQRLAAQYQFFHWHLEFPQVFGSGEWGVGNREPPTPHSLFPTPSPGFDVVLGNPPWERIKLQEKEWFASRDEAIATAPNAAARRKLIAALPKTNPMLFAAFESDKRKAEGESLFVRNSGRYPLCGRGDVNTYTLFAELARHVQSDAGRVGVIVPSGIATDDTTKYYFQDIMDSAALVSLYDFENRAGLFPAVDSRMKFCLLTLTGADRPAQEGAQFVFFALDVAHLRDAERRFTLSAADIALLNPNTRTCPIFRSQRDAELTKAIYRRVPVLIREGPPEENPWGIRFLRMFDMSNDSGLFRTREQLPEEGWRLQGNRFVKGVENRESGVENQPHSPLPTPYLPLYEAKMLHHFDHRWATYEGLETRDVSAAEKDAPSLFVLPRYWVREEEVNGRIPHNPGWLIGFRDIARSTDERTGIFTILPIAAIGNNAPLALLSPGFFREGQLLGASLSSFVFDFIARFGVGGTHMNFFILKQLPVLPPQTYRQPCLWGVGNRELGIEQAATPHSLLPTPYSRFLLPRVLELTYTAYDLRPFAQDCGYFGPPFPWHEERRFLLRCELDAAYFHLYGIARDDVDYIMDTFPIVRRKDEAAHGEYRTKRVILEIYDEMAGVMGIGSREWGMGERATPDSRLPTAYQTRLDPPPGHPDAAHPWDAAYLGPELPREQWWQEDSTQMNADAAQMNADKEKSARISGSSASSASSSSRHQRSIREPGPTLELKPPPAPPPKPKTKPTPSLIAQPALITDFAPPKGSRSQRLKIVMALGQPKNQAELQALAGALTDEDDSIRWLAGSSLTRLGGLAVVNMLAAFLQSRPGETATQEALKVLGLIADTDPDASVQELARQALP